MAGVGGEGGFTRGSVTDSDGALEPAGTSGSRGGKWEAMWSTAGIIIALGRKEKMLLNEMIARFQPLPQGQIDCGMLA